MNQGQQSRSKMIDEEKPTPSEICAVIITYCPDTDVPERARLIGAQVSEVVVVDNGSDALYSETLRRLSRVLNVTVLRNDKNRGLASALNQGARWAKDQGYEWILLFDQDSTPFEWMVAELTHIHQELGKEAVSTLLNSNFVDVNTGRAFLNPLDHTNRSWVNIKTMTTSGTLMPLSIFNTLGPFRCDLFVDFVDMEYGLRARSAGYRLIMSVRPLMLHTVGTKTKRRFLWRTVWPSHHSTQRRFYIARNLMLLLHEYAAHDPKWAFAAIVALVKSVILVLFYEESKFSKLSFTVRGIMSGLRRIADRGEV
jgi:rhamnosyltransferase